MFENLFDKHRTGTKTKPKHGQLKDIKTNEISMVDSPANKQPFLFFKRDGQQGNLQDVLSAEKFDEAELELVKTACAHLQKVTSDQAEAISCLVLGSGGDSPNVILDKLGNISLSDDLEDDDEKVLGDALEVVSELDTTQLSAVRTLLKMDGEIKKALWPSLTGAADVEKTEDDGDETVSKNTSGLKWPSLTAHVSTEEQPVEKVAGALWPSLSGRAAG